MALLTVNVEGVRGGKGTQRFGPEQMEELQWTKCERAEAEGAGLQGGKSGTWHSPAGSGSVTGQDPKWRTHSALPEPESLLCLLQ